MVTPQQLGLLVIADAVTIYIFESSRWQNKKIVHSVEASLVATMTIHGEKVDNCLQMDNLPPLFYF